MKRFCLLIFSAAIMLLPGCDNTPEKPQQGSQPAKAEVETGRFALQKMIPPARLWAADAQTVRMSSTSAKDNLGRDGKAGFWQATFASPSRQKSQAFTWSGMVGKDAPPRGIDHGPEDTFNPANRSTQPFDLAYLKTDSDQAFEVAQKHGGKQLLEKNPNQEVIYILDWDPTSNQLRWHVIYGSSPNNSQLTVIVNASTGDFVHKE